MSGLTIGATMDLPVRANAITYTKEEVAAIVDALNTAPMGTGVVVSADLFDTDNKARARARVVQTLVAGTLTAEDPRLKVRAHALPGGDDGKEFIAAVSLGWRAEKTDDETGE